MKNNVVTPKSVSFEDALRNLASRLTGQPAAKLPRTQEGIVQFMAENIPAPVEMAEAVTQEVLVRLAKAETENAYTLDRMAEAVTQEVIARLTAAPPAGETENPGRAPQEDRGASSTPGDTPLPGEGGKPDRPAPVAGGKPKREPKTKTEK